MFATLIWLSGVLLPIFIFCTMANVGMTQDPRRIVAYWKNWPFYLKMLLANFAAAPTIMYCLLQLWQLSPQYEAALLVFSICAGAPFLIKLTKIAKGDLAFAAGLLVLLHADHGSPHRSGCSGQRTRHRRGSHPGHAPAAWAQAPRRESCQEVTHCRYVRETNG